MVKVQATEDFTLKKFEELKNIERKDKDEAGKLFKGDIFECDKDMVKYLLGDNPADKIVVEVIEVIPEIKEEKKKKKKIVEI